MNIAIILLTAEGLPLARALQKILNHAEIHGLEKRLQDTDRTFTNIRSHLHSLYIEDITIIGICASGILVRTLSPLLNDKRVEPPVIAVAEDGSVAVPLLGGHRGANVLARKIAKITGGQAAITTTSELRMGIALEDMPPGWNIGNPEQIKPITAALLAGEDVVLDCRIGNADWLNHIPFSEEGKWRILITERNETSIENTLVFHPPVLTVGVGCERGVALKEIEMLVRTTLNKGGYAIGSVACIASIDLKIDEAAVQELATQVGVPLRFFSAAELEAEAPRLQYPSRNVFNSVGCHGVAEGAALAVVGKDGKLVVSKTKSKKSTCAIGWSKSPIDLSKNEINLEGHLAIVGIGPGEIFWRSPEASHIIRAAETIVGYKPYLDQLASEIKGKELYEGKLGEEVRRTNYALEQAASGKRVALISSGDAGIYALASLVFELIEQTNNQRWNQISIEVIPGISALQAVASRVGAPLGNDFCAISLSDLMTPKTTILNRLAAAAKGDFVVALYNPQSKRRRQMLNTAREILLSVRPADTPVVIAKNVGRKDEKILLTSLNMFETEGVDMTTLVLIGSSQTRSFRHGGQWWTYTPRGYSTSGFSDKNKCKNTGLKGSPK